MKYRTIHLDLCYPSVLQALSSSADTTTDRWICPALVAGCRLLNDFIPSQLAVMSRGRRPLGMTAVV